MGLSFLSKKINKGPSGGTKTGPGFWIGLDILKKKQLKEEISTVVGNEGKLIETENTKRWI